jgi:hypothetical protein
MKIFWTQPESISELPSSKQNFPYQLAQDDSHRPNAKRPHARLREAAGHFGCPPGQERFGLEDSNQLLSLVSILMP